MAMIMIVGCTPESDETKMDDLESEDNIGSEDDIVDSEVQDPRFSLSKISEHDSEESCWLAIHGKVYDVTEFLSEHPGGAAILEGCGKDATEQYETKPTGNTHSQNARDMLEEYYIGDLEE